MPLPAYVTEFLMAFVGDVDIMLPRAKFVTTQPPNTTRHLELGMWRTLTTAFDLSYF